MNDMPHLLKVRQRAFRHLFTKVVHRTCKEIRFQCAAGYILVSGTWCNSSCDGAISSPPPLQEKQKNIKKYIN